ncbi:hypothetical protein D3C81_2098410 [compost metagenome]
MLDQKIVVARGDVVEVVGFGVKARHAGRVQIIGVLAHQHRDPGGQGGDQGLGQGALAGAGASGDGDENGHGRSPAIPAAF